MPFPPMHPARVVRPTPPLHPSSFGLKTDLCEGKEDLARDTKTQQKSQKHSHTRRSGSATVCCSTGSRTFWPRKMIAAAFGSCPFPSWEEIRRHPGRPGCCRSQPQNPRALIPAQSRRRSYRGRRSVRADLPLRAALERGAWNRLAAFPSS